MPVYIATEELLTLTINALTSIRKTSDVYVIVVDDGSPMDVSILSKYADCILHNVTNLGFAPTCNRGIALAMEAGFEFIVVVNNDIEVYPGWLEAMVYPFREYENVGLTGLISSKEKYIEGKHISKYQVAKITSGGLLGGWMQSGGLLMVPNKVLEDIGLYDEQFKVGGEEDVDLFLRIREKYQIVMSGYSCFWHKEGATRWNDDVLPGYKAKNKKIEESNYDRFTEKWGWDIRKEGLHFYEEILE
jgi:GT2 family glycosyltransferase